MSQPETIFGDDPPRQIPTDSGESERCPTCNVKRTPPHANYCYNCGQAYGSSHDDDSDKVVVQ